MIPSKTDRGRLLCVAPIALVLAVMAIYVANAWTPSHYQQAANFLGIDTVRPLIGASRYVRSDEWGVLTPYFQIAVQNDFGAVNRFSPFHEPLKAFFALPSRDWSMAFKPDLWGFLVLDPARAFSLHYALLTLSFVGGFSLLLRQLGCRPAYAAVGASILFFSQFVQAWWTSNAALAWAPWPFVVFLWRGPPVLRVLAMAYATSVWLIGELYPPFILSGALGLGVLALAFRSDAFRPWNLLIVGAGALAGVGVAWLHYADLIPVMAQTVYPGRRLSPGGELHLLQMIAHLFPSFLIEGQEPIAPWPTSACEIAVIGSYLPLAMMAFGRLKVPARVDLRPLIVWVAGLLIMAAWMVLPIPAAFAPVLNLTPSYRMLLGFGLALSLGVVVLAERIEWTLTPIRLGLFTTAVVLASMASKHLMTRQPYLLAPFDLLILLVLGIFLMLRRIHPTLLGPREVVIASVGVTAVLTFGLFNPVQSAFPIFSPQHSAFLEALRRYAAANPRGFAVADGAFGATINGAGVPAINHALMQPRLEFMRRAYSDMPAAAFDNAFNRYEHLLVAPRWAPGLTQADVVAMPPDPFAIPAPVEVGSDMTGSAAQNVAVVPLGPGRWGVTASGRTDWKGIGPGQRLVVAMDPRAGRIVKASAYRLARIDVVMDSRDADRYAAGYSLRLEVEAAARPDEGAGPLLSVSAR